MTERIGKRYEVLETLGVGGQAAVLKARDHQHGRLVALKVYECADGVSPDALLAEAGVLLRLRPHPGLPLVRDDFFDEDRYVIVMDWVDGADLDRILAERGDPGLPYRIVLDYLTQAAAALDHLHAHDPPAVHGDVKPANLIVTRGGEVVLVDFGLAAFEHRERPMGTPAYMAPEVVAGQRPTVAADIYALAATTVTLLSGRAPDGTRPAWEGIERADIGPLVRTLRKGLATDPAARPATSGEFVERLRAHHDAALPAGTVTFLITEIVNAETLWESHADAMAALHEQLADLILANVERHNGRVCRLSPTDDTTMSVFGLASGAARAALALHESVAAAHWPGRASVTLRIALHSGEAELRDGDYHGVAPRVARQLVTSAPPGGTIVSPSATALLGEAAPVGSSFASPQDSASGGLLLVRGAMPPEAASNVRDETPGTGSTPAGGSPSRAPLSTGGQAWRQRLLSPPVAKAMVSPLGITAAGAGAAAGIAVAGVRMALAGALVAWLVRVAAAIPRGPRPDRIEPYALDEPWRSLVKGALEARERFNAATQRAPKGPLRERIEVISQRIDDSVAECWRVGQRGQALARARSQLDDAAIRQKIAEMSHGRGEPSDLAPAAAHTVRALRSQLETAARMDRVILESRDRISLIEARLLEAAARVLELSAQADVGDLRSLGAEVEQLVGELEAFHASLAELTRT